MTGDVVDVNVLRTANGQADHVGPDCQLAAIDFLLQCRGNSKLVLDDYYKIMELYAVGCSHSGQPGVGDQFFVWARDNIASLEKAKFDVDSDGNISSFPDDPDLATFDWDDRIYIATALATKPPSRLINAVDSDYSEHGEQLARAGLDVIELCPEALHQRAGGGGKAR